MLSKHNPNTIAAAFSSYSLGVEAPAQARWLHVSGQVGVAPDGSLAESPEAQMETAFRNILAILGSAGMGPHDLVKLTVFLTRSEDIGRYRSLYFDREGRTYLGTSRGVAVVTTDGTRWYGARDGLGGRDVTSLMVDREGALWVGFLRDGMSMISLENL